MPDTNYFTNPPAFLYGLRDFPDWLTIARLRRNRVLYCQPDASGDKIGIGRILTNPPSHTTHRAAPQWAVLNLTARRIDGRLIVTLGFHPEVANREQSLLC
jgi:hypothetical protein